LKRAAHEVSGLSARRRGSLNGARRIRLLRARLFLSHLRSMIAGYGELAAAEDCRLQRTVVRSTSAKSY